MSTVQLVLKEVLEIAYSGRWIDIVRCLPFPGRKTDIYAVVTRAPCIAIATIRWYGPWRQYALFPEPETVWEPRCLREVTKFLAQRTQQQRQPTRAKTRMEELG